MFFFVYLYDKIIIILNYMSYSWRKKRQRIFIYSLSLIILALIFYKSYPYIFPAPNCFDNKLNGDESGIDCGGSCELSCHNEVLPLEVKFARSIEAEENLYDLIGMVQNKNSNRNIKDNIIKYTFYIYDKAGSLLKSVDGYSPLPVGQTFPIIVQNIPLDLHSSGNSISNVVLDINFINNDWFKVDSIFTNNFFTIISTNFEQNKNNISQLNVSLKNKTKATFRNVPVRVTLEDDKGNFAGVNETIISEIKGEADVELSFTWRGIIPLNNPKISVYPIITPGSDFR